MRGVVFSIIFAVSLLAGFALPGALSAQSALTDWRLSFGAAPAWSGFYGSGWQDILSERSSDEPVIALVDTSSSPVVRPQFLGRVSTRLWQKSPWRAAVGFGWVRQGGVYDFHSTDASGKELEGSQTVLRDYLLFPVEGGWRGSFWRDRLGLEAYAGISFLVPYAGVLVRTELGDSEDEVIYDGSAFRSLVPAASLHVAADTPVGPGRLGVFFRAMSTILGIEADSKVWQWRLTGGISYSLSFTQTGKLLRDAL